jgi:hypothetical protein
MPVKKNPPKRGRKLHVEIALSPGHEDELRKLEAWYD